MEMHGDHYKKGCEEWQKDSLPGRLHKKLFEIVLKRKIGICSARMERV